MNVFRDPDFAWTVRWIRVEAAAIFLAALWATRATHGSWTWFFALFLAPDLLMAGYLFGRLRELPGRGWWSGPSRRQR